jgi:hypothetical protein
LVSHFIDKYKLVIHTYLHRKNQLARNYHQGTFKPVNPKKYNGDVTKIIFRSSWEKKLMIRLDTDPSIITWSSEELVIPYVSPLDVKIHRYFPDFVITYRVADGSIRKGIIEVKPYAQTIPPKMPKRKTKAYVESVQTYMVNEAKWDAAEHYCKKNGYSFIKMTEKELGIR